MNKAKRNKTVENALAIVAEIDLRLAHPSTVCVLTDRKLTATQLLSLWDEVARTLRAYCQVCGFPVPVEIGPKARERLC